MTRHPIVLAAVQQAVAESVHRKPGLGGDMAALQAVSLTVASRIVGWLDDCGWQLVRGQEPDLEIPAWVNGGRDG